MIKGGAKQRATSQSARELSRELFHSSDRRHLRHVFTQHVEILQQQRSLVLQRRLKGFAVMHRILNLTKDPWVSHRATADQNSVAASFAKAIERLLDRINVAAAGNWNADDLLDLFY